MFSPIHSSFAQIRTKGHSNSFCTAYLWNTLPGASFPPSYNLDCFTFRKDHPDDLYTTIGPDGKQIILRRYLNDQADTVDTTQIGFINQALGHLQQGQNVVPELQNLQQGQNLAPEQFCSRDLRRNYHQS